MQTLYFCGLQTKFGWVMQAVMADNAQGWCMRMIQVRDILGEKIMYGQTIGVFYWGAKPAKIPSPLQARQPNLPWR